jgi:hypothetical protein
MPRAALGAGFRIATSTDIPRRTAPLPAQLIAESPLEVVHDGDNLLWEIKAAK